MQNIFFYLWLSSKRSLAVLVSFLNIILLQTIQIKEQSTNYKLEITTFYFSLIAYCYQLKTTFEKWTVSEILSKELGRIISCFVLVVTIQFIVEL
jgi:hypothetical protein